MERKSGSSNNEKKVEEVENPDSGIYSGDVRELVEELSRELSEHHLSDTSSPLHPDDKNISEKQVSEECSEVEQVESGIIVDIGDFAELGPSVQLTPVATDDQKELLDNIFTQDVYGNTQLHIAAVHGCEKTVSALIGACPQKSWFSTPNMYMETALHYAVLKCNAVIARMLVRAGASLAARDLFGQTPLHIATANLDIHCVHALLAPVDVKVRIPASVLDQKNYDGQACVHIATKAGQKEMLQCLAYYDCDLNQSEGHAGWTPLHIAARGGKTELVQWLLSERASPQVQDYAGRTPRRLAKRYRHHDTHKLLPDDEDSGSDSEYDSSDDDAFLEMLSSRPGLSVA